MTTELNTSMLSFFVSHDEGNLFLNFHFFGNLEIFIIGSEVKQNFEFVNVTVHSMLGINMQCVYPF